MMQQYFERLIRKAVARQVTDIYFHPEHIKVSLYFLTADKYQKIETLELVEGQALIRYIKYHMQMNLAETRRPQVGHWHYPYKQERLHLRASTVADFKLAESLVLRIIYPLKNLSAHFKNQPKLNEFGTAVQHGKGLFVIAGTMGAGKSTTLAYLLATFLKHYAILSIEDPVEIEQAHILQLQVNHQAQMTYATLFKLALRHHPQVIVIGEIRDQETAKIVIEAALSGHLILTTMHALGLVEIRQRFLNLGIDVGDLTLALAGQAFQKRLDQDVIFDYEIF